MDLNLIALAIPVFSVLILIEFAIGWLAQDRTAFRINDTVCNLSCGIWHEVSGFFHRALVLGVYVWMWRSFALIDWSATPALQWVLGIVLYDLTYYWWHRFTHETRIGWATHVVHHQSEDFNLGVALRQSVTVWVFGFPFHLPLAILGIDPVVYAGAAGLSLLYQFWIHTERIRTLGPLELVLNTPSHHRVHHAVDRLYLDRNYGAILIVWDRLFGTFQAERIRPTYGTVTPLKSFDPTYAQLAYFAAIAREVRSIRSWPELRRCLLGPPALLETGDGDKSDEMPRKKYDPQSSPYVGIYVLAQLAPVAAGLTVMELHEAHFETAQIVAAAGAIVLSTWSWSALTESRPYATTIERLRLVVVASIAYAFFAPSIGYLALGYAGVSVVVLSIIRR